MMSKIRRTTIAIPEVLYREVEDLAEKEHRKPTNMLSRLVEEAVESRRAAAARRAAFESGVKAAFGGLTAEAIAEMSGQLASRLHDEHLD